MALDNPYETYLSRVHRARRETAVLLIMPSVSFVASFFSVWGVTALALFGILWSVHRLDFRSVLPRPGEQLVDLLTRLNPDPPPFVPAVLYGSLFALGGALHFGPGYPFPMQMVFYAFCGGVIAHGLILLLIFVARQVVQGIDSVFEARLEAGKDR